MSDPILEAQKVANTVYTEAFRTRAREMGGVNDRNRRQITEEAGQAANVAYYNHLFKLGWHICKGLDCTVIMSPAFARCVNCENSYQLGMKTAARQFTGLTEKEY